MMLLVERDTDNIPYVMFYDDMLQFQASFHSRKRCAKYIEERLKHAGVKE